MIINELIKIYKEKEYWHKNKLPDDEAYKYFNKMIMNNNIITYIKDGTIYGYLEFWRINYEQFGRLMCNKSIGVQEENINDGNIAYISNMWIEESERGDEAFEYLSKLFLIKNIDAEFFTAHRRTKKSEPIKIYKREEIFKHFKLGE